MPSFKKADNRLLRLALRNQKKNRKLPVTQCKVIRLSNVLWT
jgi:hypothetical protein